MTEKKQSSGTRRAKGEGTYVPIQTKNSIHWKYILVRDGITYTGQGSTKKIAKEKVENKFKKEDRLKESDNYQLQVAMKEWLYTYKITTASKSKTIDTLESTFNSQINRTTLGRKKIYTITKLDIQKHLNSIAVDKSNSTLKKTYSLLKQYFDFQYSSAPQENPMIGIKIPKSQVKEKEMTVLNDDEIELFMKEIDRPYINGKSGYRYGYMLGFILWSYMRIGEVLALQMKDADLENNIIHISKALERVVKRNRDKTPKRVYDEDSTKPRSEYKWDIAAPKSKSGIRDIPLYHRATECLEKYISLYCKDKTDKDFIFTTESGNHVSTQQAGNTLKAILKNTNINKDVSIHGLRHSGISYFARHGMQMDIISTLAGHADTAVTQRVYYNLIPEQFKDPYKDL